MDKDNRNFFDLKLLTEKTDDVVDSVVVHIGCGWLFLSLIVFILLLTFGLHAATH